MRKGTRRFIVVRRNEYKYYRVHISLKNLELLTENSLEKHLRIQKNQNNNFEIFPVKREKVNLFVSSYKSKELQRLNIFKPSFEIDPKKRYIELFDAAERKIILKEI